MSEVRLCFVNTEDIIAEHLSDRKVSDCYALSLLSESIRENGVLEPLVLTSAENGKFHLVLGFRRLRAARIAGLKRVPAAVCDIDGAVADALRLCESLKRCEQNFFEEAESIMRFVKKHKLSLRAAAALLETTESAIENKLLLLNLDGKLRKSIEAARLSERHASALLRLSLKEREEALSQIIANKLAATETEEYIERQIFPKKEEKKSKCAIGDLRLFENSLGKLVETARKGGINAKEARNETETHIEYTVVIKKQGLGTA